MKPPEPLKPLADHDHERDLLYSANNPPRSGVACPVCGAELVDDPRLIVLSRPPRIPVSCSLCGFTGDRIA